MSTTEKNTADDSTEAPAVATGEFEPITLDTPIKRGNKTVDVITLRKPKAGELRGVALTDLLQMDVNALQRILPRLSQPILTADEVADMNPADLVQIGGGVAGFLLPNSAKQDNAS